MLSWSFGIGLPSRYRIPAAKLPFLRTLATVVTELLTFQTDLRSFLFSTIFNAHEARHQHDRRGRRYRHRGAASSAYPSRVVLVVAGGTLGYVSTNPSDKTGPVSSAPDALGVFRFLMALGARQSRSPASSLVLYLHHHHHHHHHRHHHLIYGPFTVRKAGCRFLQPLSLRFGLCTYTLSSWRAAARSNLTRLSLPTALVHARLAPA